MHRITLQILLHIPRVVLQLMPCFQSQILVEQHRRRSPYPCAADANQRQPNHMHLLHHQLNIKTYAPASFRLLYFAPPIQSGFSSSYVDALNRNARIEMRMHQLQSPQVSRFQLNRELISISSDYETLQPCLDAL